MSNRGGGIEQGPHETKSIQNIKYTHFSISPVSSLLLRCFSLGCSALHVLKCLPQAYSNQPAPKRSFTTAHRNISSSFATNALNPNACTHFQTHTRMLRSLHVACLLFVTTASQPIRISADRYRRPSGNGASKSLTDWTNRVCAFLSVCSCTSNQDAQLKKESCTFDCLKYCLS